MTYSLRAINPDGSHEALLPDCDSVQVSVAFSDVGSLQFDYAVNGANAALVKDQLEVGVFDEGEEVPDTRSIIESSNGQRLAPEGVLYRSYSGRNMWKVLDESLVYAASWPTSAPSDGKVAFASVSPGVILGTLFNKAQSLGELTGITRDFTGSVDSNGNAWVFTLTREFDMGLTLLQVVQNMTDSGVAEFRMKGRVLQAFNPGTLGTDRSIGPSPLVLWAGRNVMEAPEQTNSAGLRTVALVKGEDGIWTEVSDSTAVAQYGRRAMFVSQGGVSDVGTLSVVGQSSLDQNKRVRSELTYKYVPGGDQNFALAGGYGEDPYGEGPYGGLVGTAAIRPMRDYIPGDWVFTDMTGELQKVRIRQVMIEWGAGDDPTAYTLVLNDKFMERDVALARKVEGITGGASTNGGSMPSDTPGEDRLAPAAPSGLAASSDAYVDDQGHTYAQITASWLAPTTNADGTVLEDLDHYEVQWYYVNMTLGTSSVIASSTIASWSPVAPGEVVNVSVIAVDRAGNRSDPSPWVSVLSGSDVTPPPVPSTPVLTTPFPGMVRISWDGLGAFGEALPPDFKFVEVHWSAVNNFTPDATTLHDMLTGGMLSNATGIPYDQPVYIKFVAVDHTGNKSDPSAQASATPYKIGVDDINFTAVDIGGGFHTYIGATDPSTDPGTTVQEGEIWIDTANDNEPKRWDATASAWVSVRDQVEITEGRIAAGAVTAGKIAAGAITAGSAIIGNAAISSAQIASVSAGKITAGTLVADVTVSSRIKTADSGARVELNNLGLLAYNGSGYQTVKIGSDGSALVTGTYRTAVSGERIEITPGSPHTIKFYNSAGTLTGTIDAKSGGVIDILGAGGGTSWIQAGQDAITLDTTNCGIQLDGSSLDLSASYAVSITQGEFHNFSKTVLATVETSQITINQGYRLNTDRIEASMTGFLRLEPSSNVVSLVTYNNTYTSAANMYVTSFGSYGRATSSAKYKVNIDRDTWSANAPLDAIQQLRPTTYWDRGDCERLAHQLDTHGPLKEGEDEYDHPRQLLGLIAEDVAALGLDDLVVFDAEGAPDGVQYERLAVALLPWLHDLQSRIEVLEKA